MLPAKNRLQEYCQKRQLELPKYHTSKAGDLWESAVITCDGFMAKSDKYQKKVQAENDAAEQALEKIKQYETYTEATHKAAHKYSAPQNPTCILLIDLENIPDAINIQNDLENVKIMGFVNKYNSGILKKRELIESKMELIIVETPGPNAADHALSFYAGYLYHLHTSSFSDTVFGNEHTSSFSDTVFEHLPKNFSASLEAKNKYKNIKWIILSSDRFAAIVIEMLRKRECEVYSITNVQDALKLLS